MIITRTPLRISIGGGGTDLPSYYRRFGGSLVSAAIDKYVYIAINRTFTDDYFLKYSDHERVKSVADIAHPILREALTMHLIQPGVEIASMADIPSGTGLGSSGTFTVGLLHALHAFRRKSVQIADLAAEACHLEIDRLGEPCGKQDQYIAAFGGLTSLSFGPDDSVVAEPLGVSDETLWELEERLLLFFTGYSRRASAMLSDQRTRSEAGDEVMFDNLHRTRELGERIAQALLAGDTESFGDLMAEHWEEKRQRSEGISNPDIDRWYEVARRAGARGGKLVGAGAGGFLLLYAESPTAVRRALREEGLSEVRFRFDQQGSTVVTAG